LVFGNGFFDFDGSWADTSYLRLTAANGFNNSTNPTNVLIRAQVENKQYGWIPRISISHKNGELIIGSEIRFHRSNHWSSINFGENLPTGLAKDFRFYFFNGSKNIFNGFVHESYNINNKINLLAELQLTYHKYRIFNERFVENDFTVSNIFINPRFGLNYKLNPIQNIFLSFARVTREPRLKNYYDASESSGGAIPQFEINSDGSFNFDKPLVKPESMNDFELGTSLNGNSFSLNVNLFYMFFDNEIVNNGKLDRFGQPVTGNVDRTIHTGIEISTTIKFLDHFELFGNATYSKNEIRSGKHFISDTDIIDLSGNNIGGFPEFLSNLGLQFQGKGVVVKLNAKYVGKFYSDNFDDNINNYLNSFPGLLSYTDNVNDSYFVMDLFASYEMNLLDALSSSKMYLQLNNIFDNLYSAHAIGQEYFPAAERNFVAGVQIGL
jgi:iron complex outermembrane receptor protein